METFAGFGFPGRLIAGKRRNDSASPRAKPQPRDTDGVGVANLINILNPEVVVIGGGLIEALGDEMMPTIVKLAKRHAMPGLVRGTKIKASKLGDDAGITSAAVLVRRSLG